MVRELRQRATIDYNVKTANFVPAWTARMGLPVEQTPPESKRKKNTTVTAAPPVERNGDEESPSTNKENSRIREVLPSPRAGAGARAAKPKAKKIKRTVASRGRDQGMRVTRIESPLPPADTDSPYRLETRRSGETRPVPGLDWMQQFSYGGNVDRLDRLDRLDAGDNSTMSEPSPFAPRGQASSQLDARANQLAARHRVSVDGGMDGGMAGGMGGGVVQGHAGVNTTTITTNTTGTHQLSEREYIQKLRSEVHALVKVSEKLEEENTNLKEINIGSMMDDAIAAQGRRMREREAASDELVNHWKDKFQKLETEVGSGYVQELEDQNQELLARLHALEVEMTSHVLKMKERDAKIAELEERNAFLEKYAKVYPTKDMGVGTEGVQRVDVGIQAPHAVVQHRARAMAPEGAPSDSMYTYGAVDAAGPHFGGMHRGHQERTYDMLPQATIPHHAGGFGFEAGAGAGAYAPGGSAGTSSVGVAAGQGAQGMPGTKESRMRKFAQQGPLVGPDGQPRQIEFYSGSEQAHGELDGRQDRDRAGEVHARGHAAGARDPTPSFLSVSPDEWRLLQQIGLTADIQGSAIVYKHPRTGFMFKFSRAVDDGEDEDDSAAGFDLEYTPVAWGRARAAIGTLLEGMLLETSNIDLAGRTQLLTMIGDALKDI